MSQGQTTPPSTHYAIPKEWLPILNLVLLVLGAIAISRGWLTSAQVSEIKTVIQSEVGSEPPATPVKSDGKPKPITAKSIASGAPFAIGDLISFIQSDEGKQLIAFVTDLLKPKPAPPVQPTIAPLTPAEIQFLIQKGIQDGIDKYRHDNPPQPMPPPPPIQVIPITPVQPVGPKILLTDGTDKPLVGNTIDAGVLFQVATDIPAPSSGWTVSRHGNVSVVTLKANAGFACSLNADPAHRSEPAWVEFFLTNFDTRVTTSARIDCNQAPQPPPIQPIVPVTPVLPVTPKPIEQVVTPVPGVVRLVLVYDAMHDDATTMAIRNNAQWWSSFASGGNTWRFVLTGSKEVEATKVMAFAQSKGLTAPYFVVSTPAGNPIKAFPVPKSIDAIIPAIQGG